MELGRAKKVVIITESMLEEQITRLLCTQGAKGYTVYHELTGKGRHGIRSGIGVLDKINTNICIEAIVAQEEMALSIMEIIHKKILNCGRGAYAGIVYLEDVCVICPEKF
jgi:PII-like signaling protein